MFISIAHNRGRCYTAAMKVSEYLNRYSSLVNAVVLASASALLLYLLRSVATGSADYSFMAWNLVLSLAALAVAAIGALLVISKKRLLVGVAVFIIWLLLLPNTFYMLTDFVHVADSGAINYLFDIVLIGCFAMNGFVHGILSLHIVHVTLRRFLSPLKSWTIVLLCILASSFAVDMGRYLRWNSWDVLTRPAALLFDVSDVLLNPAQYNRSLLITGVFFVTISSLYAVARQAAAVQWGNHAKP